MVQRLGMPDRTTIEPDSSLGRLKYVKSPRLSLDNDTPWGAAISLPAWPDML